MIAVKAGGVARVTVAEALARSILEADRRAADVFDRALRGDAEADEIERAAEYFESMARMGRAA